MTLTIVKRFNGKGKEIDENYQPVIPELVDLLSEVYHKLNAAGNTDKSNDMVGMVSAFAELENENIEAHTI